MALVFPISVKSISAKKLSVEQVAEITAQLIEQKQKENLKLYGEEWDNRELTNGDYSMKFFYKVFGDEPHDGRAMYISMHGGGSTTEQLNDKQWDNQKKLYTPEEGVYFVPRAPTNTWNLWHQEYMDGFIKKAIELAIIKENVNPNKIYIMGYSAGGDGTYQLAPRLASLWAAAAMSAGHPGDAQIRNLRNLPFAIYMGAKDAPYDRNLHAQTWSDKLDILEEVDKGGYIHDVKIYEEHGHWMKRDDSVSMQWMPKFNRNPIPNKVVWIQDDIIRKDFYWLKATFDGLKHNDKIIVSYTKDGRIDILDLNVKSFIIGLNDNMMDLNKPVEVYLKGERIFKGKVARLQKHIEADINSMSDANTVFPARLLVKGNEVLVVE